VFYTARGRILFILRTFQPRSLLLLAPALLLHEAAQALFVCLRGWLEPYSQALFWHVSHLSRTLRGRADVQDRRRMGDGGLLQDGPLPIHPGLVAETGVAAWVRRALERVLHVYYHRVKGRLGR
jgi:hypothetical protein